MWEDERHAVAGAAFCGPDHMRAGDQDVRGDKEAGPRDLPVRAEDLRDGQGQSRRTVGFHRISPRSHPGRAGRVRSAPI